MIDVSLKRQIGKNGPREGVELKPELYLDAKASVPEVALRSRPVRQRTVSRAESGHMKLAALKLELK